MTSTARPPERQIRAVFDGETITVYQAYSAAIAVPAAASGSLLGTPFSLNRMTWVKPSFLWMMYRSGWATKPGQEHVLAIRMSRAGFEDALAMACLSHFDPDAYADRETWSRRKEASPVRVQWDPERDITLGPLPWRAIQIGLAGEAARLFAQDWTVQITDITEHVRQVHELVVSGRRDAAVEQLPDERPYPLAGDLAQVIGAT
ncbi:DUF4291 domain-containing protein [Cellulomonas avistercoris]|uniref:DUF4291 domain-containing protein n=1 Tax=Cellulomonas avistercoris TaxID=2762242 RepID=UPI00296AF9E0|nr:DUF4291 domain-containing protein [Cellulomonas avistercoris]